MERWQLYQMRSLPLEAKIIKSQLRIREWYEYWQGNVYVSFSGGKDSTALLHLVRSVYREVPAVFCNTGLEYPEIVEFVKPIDNVEIIRPNLSFKSVIEIYGYPVVSKEQSQYINETRNTKSKKLKNIRLHGNKHGRGKVSDKWLYLIDAPFKISNKCCEIMKKRPFRQYESMTGRKPFLGTTTEESSLRLQKWLKEGCNSFNSNRPTSTPLSFWTDADIWEYIRNSNIAYSEIYDMGWERTGCMWCLYGIQYEPYPNRLQRMQETHPQLYNYCIDKLGIGEVMDYMNIPYHTEDKRNKKVEYLSLFD